MGRQRWDHDAVARADTDDPIGERQVGGALHNIPQRKLMMDVGLVSVRVVSAHLDFHTLQDAPREFHFPHPSDAAHAPVLPSPLPLDRAGHWNNCMYSFGMSGSPGRIWFS